MTGRNTVRVVSPNQPKTPMRAVRVDDATWDEVRAAAERLGVTVSDYVRGAIIRRLAAGD